MERSDSFLSNRSMRSNLSRGENRRHYVGVAMVLSVAVIWVSSSEMIQYIFGDLEFSKPFFITYFNTGLFSIYLLRLLVRRSFWFWVGNRFNGGGSGDVDAAEGGETRELLDGGKYSLVEARNFKSIDIPGSADDAQFNLPELMQRAFFFSPLWFIANYTFNLGLHMTSVSSSSTLSTASGLFTFLIGVSIGAESYSAMKALSVILNILGVGMIGLYDIQDIVHKSSFVGDLFSLLAALGYGLYTTFLKVKLEDDRKIDMLLFFGFVGLFNLLILWPLFLVLDKFGFETFEMPSGRLILLLTVNGLLGTVLSDYLWARSVLLTTPLIATIATSLSIPLSLIADTIIHGSTYTVLYFTGTILVIMGFVFSNVAEAAIQA
ncbi:hypothetical protein NDN08_001834 [Rhodosorus marinus]|uniref:EamA domain-containing protein n=1 Tax=Rhodosorus marinus TaxID=101924 RepID=A0AAV8UVN9_9RHOD|nr:hypothetical protein NDN08_001834 [Rhodosorus marinus]